MKSRFAAAVAVMLMLSTALIVLTANEAEAADTEIYQVAGYVVDDQAVGNTALAGVYVTVVDSLGPHYATTDAKGYFAIAVSGTAKLTITLSYSGYTVRSCPCGTTQSDGTILLDLSGITPTAVTVEGVTTYTYTFTSAAGGLQPIIMSSTVGVVVVTVTDRNSTSTSNGISEAEVTLVSATDSAIRYSGITDGSGRYTFSDVRTGYYYLSASSNGYESSSVMTVSVANGYTYLSTTMAQKPTDIYLGLSLGHLLMLIGVLLGVLLIMISWIMYRRGPSHVDTSDLDRSQHEIQKEEEPPEEEEQQFRPGSGSS